MKNWNKIEEKLNLWLEALIETLKLRASRKTPGKLKSFAQKTKEKKQKSQLKFHEKVRKVFVPAVDFFKNFGSHFQKFSNKLQAKVVQMTLKMRNMDWKKLDLEKVGIALGALILPYAKKLQIWLNSLKPQTLAKIVSIGTVSSLTVLSLINTGNKIQDESQKREPAQAEMVEQVNKGTSVSTRPGYFKKQERFLTIHSVRLPIIVDNSPNPKTKSVKADFTFVTSNRYTRNYLFKYEHLVKDQLNLMVEPIVPSFPLKQEGKQILKDKIEKELNALINELGIEGSIEEVYIESILEV